MRRKNKAYVTSLKIIIPVNEVIIFCLPTVVYAEYKSVTCRTKLQMQADKTVQ